MIEMKKYTTGEMPFTSPNSYGGINQSLNLMTEDELIKFLRILQISKGKNYHNVISHLKRYRKLPCIHLCRQPLYSREAVLSWIEEITQKEMKRCFFYMRFLLARFDSIRIGLASRCQWKGGKHEKSGKNLAKTK